MPSRISYAWAAAAVLLVEVIIALFVHDSFVRPHLGDSLAVVLVYLGLRAASRLRVISAALTAFAVACAIEFGQKIGILDMTGLGQFRLARIVLGTDYDPHDFLAYAAGALAVLVIESALRIAQRRR